MDGLLISGGADLHPERYGQPSRGSTTMEPDRDALEWEAWQAAQSRGLPVLGLCRGLQAINAFSGGTLVQHVDGHQGPRWGKGPAKTHPLRIAPGHAAGPDPVPDQRRRRRPEGQLVPPPGRAGRRVSRRASSPTPGPAARPATWSRAWRPPTAGSCSASSATRSGPSRPRRRSIGCSASSSTPPAGRPTAADRALTRRTPSPGFAPLQAGTRNEPGAGEQPTPIPRQPKGARFHPVSAHTSGTTVGAGACLSRQRRPHLVGDDPQSPGTQGPPL